MTGIHDYREVIESRDLNVDSDWSAVGYQMIKLDAGQPFFTWGPETRCRFCTQSLTNAVNNLSDGGEASSHHDQVQVCEACGWWREQRSSSIYIGEGDFLHQTDRRYAILRHFSVADKSVPIDALRRAIAQRSDLLHDIHPTALERLVASVLGEHHDCEVRHIGGPGDGGVDVLLVQGGLETLVQVKRRERAGSVEGVSVVRELLGTMILGEARRAIFVSTSERFSKPAAEAAALASRLGAVERIDLLGKHDLIDLMDLHAPAEYAPWVEMRWADPPWDTER